MALPTNGYESYDLNYDVNGVTGSVQIRINVTSPLYFPNIEHVLPYLETALSDFKTAYDLGESTDISVIKTFDGWHRETILE